MPDYNVVGNDQLVDIFNRVLEKSPTLTAIVNSPEFNQYNTLTIEWVAGGHRPANEAWVARSQAVGGDFLNPQNNDTWEVQINSDSYATDKSGRILSLDELIAHEIVHSSFRLSSVDQIAGKTDEPQVI